MPAKLQRTRSDAWTRIGPGSGGGAVAAADRVTAELSSNPANAWTPVATAPAGSRSSIVIGTVGPSTGASPRLVTVTKRRPLAAQDRTLEALLLLPARERLGERARLRSGSRPGGVDQEWRSRGGSAGDLDLTGAVGGLRASARTRRRFRWRESRWLLRRLHRRRAPRTAQGAAAEAARTTVNYDLDEREGGPNGPARFDFLGLGGVAGSQRLVGRLPVRTCHQGAPPRPSRRAAERGPRGKRRQGAMRGDGTWWKAPR